MGGMKRIMEERQHLQAEAIEILCQVGALRECDFHSGNYVDTGLWDLTDAYKVANARVTAGDIDLSYGLSRRDFTDIIKDVYEESPDSCRDCDKWLSED